jgi:hypothetical protein
MATKAFSTFLIHELDSNHGVSQGKVKSMIMETRKESFFFV